MATATTIATTTMLQQKRARVEVEEEDGAQRKPNSLRRQVTRAILPEGNKETDAGNVSTLQLIATILDSMLLQSTMYFIFVIIFQLLTSSMRIQEEFTLCGAPRM